MNLPMHAGYEQLVAKARQSHAQGRSSQDITDEDVALARLYSYAFRMHTIGAFHATRTALEALEVGDDLTKAHLCRATEALADMANQGMEEVPSDFRVVLATFHRYDRSLRRILGALEQAHGASRDPRIADIAALFEKIMAEITTGNGLHLTRDLEAPQQASFIVPNLGIMIVPLVYGDHHSWNLAFLSEQHLDVPMHRHYEGVEIHLGYNPIQGYMILDQYKSPVEEGYALPIPPMTRHGWANTMGKVHHVPFIFGSLKQAGWGVFLDVEPQPLELEQLQTVDRTDWRMSAAVFLERQIDSASKLRSARRQVMIPSSVTSRSGSGGLELAVSRATEAGLTFAVGDFRIVSVVRGQGLARVGPVQRTVGQRDHFGIPAGMTGSIEQTGDTPLVALDAVIKT